MTETPGVAVADSGYWNEQQMDKVVEQWAAQVLIPPDAGKRDTPRPGWDGGRYTLMRQVLAERATAAGYTENERRWSSPCSHRPSTTGASTSSSDEADPPHARNGD